MLVVAFSVVALGAVIQSGTPSHAPLGTAVFTAMAAGLGAASGATFALVAQRAPADQVGAVTGLVGAAGGLGGMGSIFGHVGDYRNGLLGLAVMAVLVLLLAASMRRTPAARAA